MDDTGLGHDSEGSAEQPEHSTIYHERKNPSSMAIRATFKHGQDRALFYLINLDLDVQHRCTTYPLFT
jgi:hypothetical protein